MNHACAAGTGSFLEEQAERLGISIKDQFAQMALASRSPIRLGERCTVFMESDLLSHQQQGASTPDLVAGLCYSIVSNYINRVVGRRRIGDRILFQGGTAFNGGVVAAFEAVTGRQITVPPHHEVTGAIGAAILARQHMRRHGGTTRFAGFDAENVDYQVRSFECEHCSNRCEINEVTAPGREPLYYGSRCDRYNRTKDREDTPAIPNLFAERQRLLFRYAHLPHGKPAAGRPTVGVPLALMNYQLLPFWGTLLAKLGLHVVVSPHSTADVIRSGVQAVLSTPCFPVKVAHGHLLELIRRGVDYVWLPSIVTLKKEFDENKFNQACPYITAFPYTMAAALKLQEKTVSMLAPVVRLEHGPHEAFRGLKALCGQLGVSKRRMWRAVLCGWAAQNKFERACRARGREVLANIPEQVRPIVVMARPYNGCDNALSLNLPTKLQRLNVLAIPLDFLDFSSDPSTHDRVFEWMYWKNGQRILHAARFVRQHPRLHAIYLSSFSCGPDSFLLGYFKRLMAPKPSLVLEIDEHSADGGVVTRLEAFIESLNAAPAKKLPVALPLLSSIAAGNGHRRRLFIPWMGDAAHGVAAGLRAKGVDAQVLPPSDASSVELGRRFCEGKECLPCIITTGDMLRVTQQPHFDAKATAFFMPRSCGPCRFGQYASLQKLILAELGHDQVAIIDPSDDSGFYNSWSEQIGQSSRLSWSAVCAIDALERAVLASRPYEKRAGDTDRLYQRLLHDLIGVIEKDPPLEQIVRFSTEAAHAFAALPVHRRRRKPLIGIVGENYVRLHHGANNQLVRQLEGYGAETTVASHQLDADEDGRAGPVRAPLGRKSAAGYRPASHRAADRTAVP
jgi:predicted nucleotide-binding protein (sugar kinase/HSP70/actin superfamily)